jgi:parvulin-like peptidyl-prolyl isomerase
MKPAVLILLGVLCAATAGWAQAPAASSSPSVLERFPDPKEVVAVVDGQPITLTQLQSFLAAMPAQNRAVAVKDPEAFLRQYALMNRLTKEAEQRKLDQQSPYREQLAYQRSMLLSTAGLNALSQEVRVSSAEAQEFYDAHKSDFAEYATKVIYIPFSNAVVKPGETRKSMTESDALALSQKIVGQLRAGADFVAMVKQHSKDEASVKRDGDFAKLKKTDNIPPNVKEVVFALKPGQISDPVRQPNGFYIFRLEAMTEPEYAAVAAQINTKVHDEKFRKKMDALRDEIEVKDLRPELIK